MNKRKDTITKNKYKNLKPRLDNCKPGNGLGLFVQHKGPYGVKITSK